MPLSLHPVPCLPMGLVSSEWGERTGEQKHPLHHTTQSCPGNEWKTGEEAPASITRRGCHRFLEG